MTSAILRQVFVGLLVIVATASEQGFAQQSLPPSYVGVSVTVQSRGGGINTVSLRVPKERSGPCIVGNVAPTVISGPVPNTAVLSTVSITPSVPAYSPGVDTSEIKTVTNAPTGQPLPPPAPGTSPFSPTVRFLSYLNLKFIGEVKLADGSTLGPCKLVTYQNDGVIVVRAQDVYKVRYADMDVDSRQRLQSAH